MRADGVAHPADKKPLALSGDCIDFYDAFCLLGASRKWSQVGPQPIEVSEALALVNEGYGEIDPDERLKFLRLIKLLDRVELKFLHSKARK